MVRATLVQYELVAHSDGTEGFIIRDILSLKDKPLCGATMRELERTFVKHSTKYDLPDSVWHLDFKIKEAE